MPHRFARFTEVGRRSCSVWFAGVLGQVIACALDPDPNTDTAIAIPIVAGGVELWLGPDGSAAWWRPAIHLLTTGNHRRRPILLDQRHPPAEHLVLR